MQLTEQQLEIAVLLIESIGSAEEYKELAYLNQSSEPNPLGGYEYLYDNNFTIIRELFDLFLINYNKAYYVIDNPRPSLWLFFTYGDTYDWEISYEVFYDFFKFLEGQINQNLI